jgi:hypothetical protein
MPPASSVRITSRRVALAGTPAASNGVSLMIVSLVLK